MGGRGAKSSATQGTEKGWAGADKETDVRLHLGGRGASLCVWRCDKVKPLHMLLAWALHLRYAQLLQGCGMCVHAHLSPCICEVMLAASTKSAAGTACNTPSGCSFQHLTNARTQRHMHTHPAALQELQLPSSSP